ncbi:hypothetical protein PIB30_043931 [Stylosanthes scabra]|uniref:MADS-box domain-containing protein n=1 Tax=Stylosanthes scabra TaxID=79078 RepID=A0ABU6XFZ8_9FABA|nr:hypothetical protein [Stylosanthes scabra]
MEVGGKKIIKRNKGKQKREMIMIHNKKSCQIAFAKRKDGIMKKANEVRALCGAIVDVIMYSPTGKAYFYGDTSMKTIKIALSNEQESNEEGEDHFLSHILDEMSKVEMQDLIANSDSLVDQLNDEKERDQTLSRVLNFIDGESSYENNKEAEKELLVLQKLLKDRISINATAASTSHHHGVDQTMVQLNTGIIGSYPPHANPFDTTRGIGDHNAPVWYPSDQHQQGFNGPFFYNASNGNGGGGGGGGDSGSGSGSHVYSSNYYNNNNTEGGIFGFPNENINNPFNNGGYGGGGFF